MKKTPLKVLILLAALAILLVPIMPVVAAAQVKAAVSVSGTVPSKVCPAYSSVLTSVKSVLADSSQKIVVTVKAYDCEKQPLSGVPITLTSNRGDIDKIQAIDSGGSPIASTGFLDRALSFLVPTVFAASDSTPNITVTDTKGFAYFQVISNVPGDIELTATADGILALPSVGATFLPLPFPKNVTVSLVLPPIIGSVVPGYNKSTGEVPIFVPKSQAIDHTKLVNMGVDIRIPFWFQVLVIFLIVLTPFLIHFVFINLSVIKKNQREEKDILEAQNLEMKKQEAMIAQETKEIQDIASKSKP